MSYCRWSTDSFRCDLYCYGDSGGSFTTHVASNRAVRGVDAPDDAPWVLIRDGKFGEFARQHQAFAEWLERAERRPIGLPFDGETFHDPDLASFRDRLIELRRVGYVFPDSVLADVNEELSSAAAHDRDLTNG